MINAKRPLPLRFICGGIVVSSSALSQLAALFFALAALPMTASAQRPSAPLTVPIYPGAERFDQPQGQVVESIHETLRGIPGGVPLLSTSKKTFVAAVAVEKVVSFFCTSLGGVASGYA